MDPKAQAREIIGRAPGALRPYVQKRYDKRRDRSYDDAIDMLEKQRVQRGPILRRGRYEWQPPEPLTPAEIHAAAAEVADREALEWLQSLRLTTSLAAPHSELREVALHLSAAARDLSRVLGKDGYTKDQRAEARQYIAEPGLRAQYAKQRAESLHRTCIAIARRDGHDVPDIPLPDGETLPVLVAKMCDAAWWLRHILRTIRRERELLAFRLELVRAGDHRYASDLAVSERADQLQRTQLWMERTTITDGDTVIPLKKIASTPRHRRSQMYRVMQGLAKRAKAEGRKPSMVTLTAPGEYHPNPSHGTTSWDGILSPRDAHEWIHQKIWLQLIKRGRGAFGASFREAHGDGCTHWHAIVFLTAAQRERWRSLLCELYDIKEDELDDREKPGCDWQDIDGDEAAAVMYAAKYSAKGTGDVSGSKHVDDATISRLDAWRATWNIRSFQFFGIPRGIIGLWREYRRLSSPDDFKRASGAHGANADDTPHPLLRTVRDRSRWRAARRGDFAGFWSLVVPIANAAGETVQHAPRIERETTETRYGERGSRPVGIDSGPRARIHKRGTATPCKTPSPHHPSRALPRACSSQSAPSARCVEPTVGRPNRVNERRIIITRRVSWTLKTTPKRITLSYTKVTPTSSRGDQPPPRKPHSGPPGTAPPGIH
jgi:hypothetical protein